MLKLRIIPCLDVKDGRVVKGINFKNIRPKIITIEIHVEKTEQIFKTETYRLLKKNNYELFSQYYQTSFFKSNEFNIINL